MVGVRSWLRGAWGLLGVAVGVTLGVTTSATPQSAAVCRGRRLVGAVAPERRQPLESGGAWRVCVQCEPVLGRPQRAHRCGRPLPQHAPLSIPIIRRDKSSTQRKAKAGAAVEWKRSAICCAMGSPLPASRSMTRGSKMFSSRARRWYAAACKGRTLARGDVDGRAHVRSNA